MIFRARAPTGMLTRAGKLSHRDVKHAFAPASGTANGTPASDTKTPPVPCSRSVRGCTTQ